MKIRIFVTVVAMVLVAACAAFDNDSKPYDGFSPDVVAPVGGGGQFQGNYKGEITLTKNGCENLAEEVDSKTPLTLNVIQNGELVSVAFEDESEASGDLEGSKTTIVKRDVSNTKIFDLEFTDSGITGVCEYIDGAPTAGQLGEPCAQYSVSLTKE